MPKKLTWKDILRQQIKNEHGFGWNVSEQSEKTKVVRRYEDDSRSSVMLPIEWKASNAREIADSVARLKEMMEIILLVFLRVLRNGLWKNSFQNCCINPCIENN